MCGICGKLRNDGKPVRDELIRRMNAALAHRGPDGEGIYLNNCDREAGGTASIGLGHRRLAIIDLSDAGSQPMSNEAQTVWMVFNGEIYNYRLLRQDLERRGHFFRSQTDSEVLIHLYEDQGLDAVAKLEGMFAFAIWDRKQETLFLGRDPVGIKPLVYCRHASSFIFASEIKAVLQDPEVPRGMDWDALNLYLTLNYIPAPFTIFSGIRKLRPGHILSWHRGEIIEKPYWNLNASKSPYVGRDLKAAQAALGSAMEDAVRMQMVADVPVGAFLSGGIDSSVVVGLMARNSSRPVKTYTIGYRDMPHFDETGYARQVADFNRTDHHEFKLGARDVIDAIPKVLEAQDEPFGDSSAVPVFIVARETARGVKVAISGDGGDELFAGYRMYRGEGLYARYRRLPAWIRNRVVGPLCMALPDSRDSFIADRIRIAKKFLKGDKATLAERFMAWNEIFSSAIRGEILVPPAKSACVRDLGQTIASARLEEWQGDCINRMLYTDFKESLPGDMLRKVDAMSMAQSLEVRVPILDRRVCELAFAMEGSLKMRGGRGKYILVETFKDILPRCLHRRPKAGFEMPVGKWLKTDLKFLLDEYLSRDVVERQGIFNYSVVQRLTNSLVGGCADTSWQLWNLIVFQVWHMHYGKK